MPASIERPQRFWSVLKIDCLVASTSMPCRAANSSSCVRVHFHSRTGAMTRSSGASVWKVTSKRTWSFPLPVQPCATATAPCSRATRTINCAIKGRPSAVASGYFPSYKAPAISDGKAKKSTNRLRTSSAIASTAPVRSALARIASMSCPCPRSHV